MATVQRLWKSGSLKKQDIIGLSPAEIRAHIRADRFTGGTEGLAKGYAQANLIIIPKDVAFDFLLFCQRNQKPCPIVEVTEPGSPLVTQVAKGDLRTDLSGYSIYQNGEFTDQVTDITKYWRDDLVGFLIGCSYSFEDALLRVGIPLRHLEENKIVSVYTSKVPCVPGGRFAGPMVVSMRPIHRSQVVRAVQVTSRFPATHGAPVHIGDPSVIGVDITKPEFDTGYFELGPEEVPVFWACGGTPQAVALQSRLPFMITHKIGHLFITDTLSESIAM